MLEVWVEASDGPISRILADQRRGKEMRLPETKGAHPLHFDQDSAFPFTSQSSDTAKPIAQQASRYCAPRLGATLRHVASRAGRRAAAEDRAVASKLNLDAVNRFRGR